MTTKSRATDEPADDAPEASKTVDEPTQAEESTPVFDQALNPTGVPNEEFPDAQPDASVEAVNEVGGDQVQAQFDEANERGYFGETPDQDDRERYTLRGQSQQGR